MQVLDTVDAATIRALHERGEFFWLDLDSPSDEELDTIGELLAIPALAIADTKEFGQRPKLDDYGARVLIVFYGAHGDELVEVHIHVSGDEVITVRRDDCAHLMGARDRTRAASARTEQDVVFYVLSALSESLRELVDRRGEEVESLGDLAFTRPAGADRQRMSRLRADLFRLQQIVAPQRDMLGRGGDALEYLPGLERDVDRHPFRDVHDDLVLTTNEIAYLRELLAEAVNVLLNQMAARVTILATLFLPLTVVSGFFGMNFGWLVRHIDSATAFFVLGVGGMLAPIAIILVLLERAGYLGSRG
jgi:magnesium transporter